MKIRFSDSIFMTSIQVNPCLFWHLSHLRNVSFISFLIYYRLTYPYPLESNAQEQETDAKF